MTIEKFLQRFFKEGALLVSLPGHTISIGGATEGDARVVVRLRSHRVAARIAANPHLATGEAYVDGDLVLERGTLVDLLCLVAQNFKHNPRRSPWLRAQHILANVLGRIDRRSARSNVAHHYDLSVDLYRRFLDRDLQYSCAYFTGPDATLEEAQEEKKRRIGAKLLLSEADRVLDIGCGWGGLGLTLAERYGARVTGVTLSTEQLALAQQRAAGRGLSNRARFVLQDYRDVTGSFDRIVSVGMFEHVGRSHYQEYFDTIAQRLADDGVALVHTIGRTDGPAPTSAWTERYIFPGGYIPSLSEILPAVEAAGLIVTDLEVLRMHYAETLRCWRERFLAKRVEIADMYDERFCRMWEYYLATSEASFRFGSNVVFQLQLAKRQDAVPMTRCYLERSARDMDALAA